MSGVRWKRTGRYGPNDGYSITDGTVTLIVQHNSAPSVEAALAHLNKQEQRIRDLEAENTRLQEQSDGLYAAFMSTQTERDTLRAERDAAVGLLRGGTMVTYPPNVTEFIEAEAARQQKRDEALRRIADSPTFFGEQEVYAPDWVRDFARAALAEQEETG